MEVSVSEQLGVFRKELHFDAPGAQSLPVPLRSQTMCGHRMLFHGKAKGVVVSDFFLSAAIPLNISAPTSKLDTALIRYTSPLSKSFDPFWFSDLFREENV